MNMTNLQDGFEISSSDLGERIGEGSYKEAFVYAHDPDFTITRCWGAVDWNDYGSDEYASTVATAVAADQINAFENERAGLHRLHSLGVPAARIFASGVFVGRGERPFPCNLMKRYAASNRCCSSEKFASVLNENTVSSIGRIHDRLDDLDIAVGDLQFLIDTEGYVVVNDPLNIKKGKSGFGYRDGLRAMAEVMVCAEYVLKARERNETPILGSTVVDLRYESTRWFHHNYEESNKLLKEFPFLSVIKNF